MSVETARWGDGVAALIDRSEDVFEAVDAAVCGALGCTETNGLVQVVSERAGKRVLCRPCAVGLLEREGSVCG